MLFNYGVLVSIELPFDPFPLISGSHQQTIIGSFFNLHSEPASATRFVHLPDGDKIALEITTPKNWEPTQMTVVMIHGLCGSHRSSYLIRLTKRLSLKGVRCVRFNMRGCGSGKGHARQIYHSGRSDDLWFALQELTRENPLSPIVIVGFSLGGHILLKMAGERNVQLSGGQVQQIIAISPPTDLFLSVQRLGSPSNLIYERYFLRMLRANVQFRHEFFEDLSPVVFPRKMSFYNFDEIYTAPQCGFAHAMDYYQKCSSHFLVPEIRVPCRILFAEDDPIICPSSLDRLLLPDVVTIYKTKKGGHLGYLATPKKNKSVRWMDHLLDEWISERGIL